MAKTAGERDFAYGMDASSENTRFQKFELGLR
jgi:hypothetical protein